MRETYHPQGDGDLPTECSSDVVHISWDVGCHPGEGLTIRKAPVLKLLVGEVLQDKLAQGIEGTLPM